MQSTAKKNPPTKWLTDFFLYIRKRNLQSSTVTILEFLARTAWTWIVTANLRSFVADGLNNLLT